MKLLITNNMRRGGALLSALALIAVILLSSSKSADATIVAKVNLGTASNYSVLASSTITNTGASVFGGSIGLYPGTSIVGFPPGIVTPPATIDQTNGAAQQAQIDLNTAYTNAANRVVNATLAQDLGNQTLQGGVYDTNTGPLEITGPLTLDGANNPDSVFIFKTGSSLTTATGSSILLINGAQACNVFWQVGSSATLDTGSSFVGNIMADQSVTVNGSVTVVGRALAMNGAVTLITDTFTQANCDTDNGGAPTSGTEGEGDSSGASDDGSQDDSSGVPGVGGPPLTGAEPTTSTNHLWSIVLMGGTALSISTLTLRRHYV